MAKEPKIVPFGKYELLEKIAVGGMAEIFKARTKGVGGFEKYLAIKRILPHLSENKDFIDMLINEAKIAVMLSHANIVQIYDLGKIDDSYFIAMEYIEGKDLRALMSRCDQIGMPLFIQHAIFISIEACKGLEYAHAKTQPDAAGPKELNIVHRDISPQNVMISYEGEVKITDFGIAKANVNISETEAGVVKGKYEYMSPEQASGLPVDRRTDIFSTGIVLYEMLTGQKPFRGESDLTILERVREAKVEPPSKYNKSIPKKLEKIVLKSLAKEGADRYQTATELKDDLTRFFYSSTFNFTTSNLAAFMKSIFAEEIKLDVNLDSTGVGKRPDLGQEDGRTISRIFGRPDSDKFGKNKNGTNVGGAPLGAISTDSTNVGASRSETQELPGGEPTNSPTSSRTLGGEQLASIEEEINRILIPGKTNAGKLPTAPSNESSATSASSSAGTAVNDKAGINDESRTSPLPSPEEARPSSQATLAGARPGTVSSSMLLGGEVQSAALELAMEIEMAMPPIKSATNVKPAPKLDDEEEPATATGMGAKGNWSPPNGGDEPPSVTGRNDRRDRDDDDDRPTQERNTGGRNGRDEPTDDFDRDRNGNGRSASALDESTDNLDRPTRSSGSGRALRGERSEATERDPDDPRDEPVPERARESTIISEKGTAAGSRSASLARGGDDDRDPPRTGSGRAVPASPTSGGTGSKVPARAVKEKVRGVTVNAPDAAPSNARRDENDDQPGETMASAVPRGGTNGSGTGGRSEGTSGGTMPGRSGESTVIGARPNLPSDESSRTGKTPVPSGSITGGRLSPTPSPSRKPDRDTRPSTGPGVTRLGPQSDIDRETSGTHAAPPDRSQPDLISRDYEKPAPRNQREVRGQQPRTTVVPSPSSSSDDQSDLYPDVADSRRGGGLHPLIMIAGGAIVFLFGVLIAKAL